jgi:hypothetical protein
VAGLDPSALVGIDVHVHVESDGRGRRSLDDELLAASAKLLDIKPEARPKILEDNAARLLGLGEPAG